MGRRLRVRSGRSKSSSSSVTTTVTKRSKNRRSEWEFDQPDLERLHLDTHVGPNENGYSGVTGSMVKMKVGRARRRGAKKSLSTSSSSKISQRAEYTHPLLTPRVITHLFAFMDIPTLKMARQVCKDWKPEATKMILRRGVAHVDGAAHSSRYDIDTFLRSMDQCAAQRYSRYNLVGMKYELPFRSLFTIYGQHMKSLSLDCYDGELDYFSASFLNKVLSNCYNLEELDIYCPAIYFLDPSSRLTCGNCKLKKLSLRAEGGIHCNILQDLINACPSLTNFTVSKFDDTGNKRFTTELFQLGEVRQIDLSKLDWMDIGGSASVLTTEVALTSLINQPLNLTFLEITLWSGMMAGEATLQQMFQHLSGTLRCFILANYPGTVSPRFPVIIPPTMTKLEKVEIRTGTSQFFMGPLASAVNLPRLKTFILYRMPTLELQHLAVAGVQYDFELCWSLLDNAWFASRCSTLETLQLPCGFNNSRHMYHIHKVFPNLRDLRLQNPSEEVIKLVFHCCTQLERLSLRLKVFPVQIDALISGFSARTCERMLRSKKFHKIRPVEAEQRKPGLRNLKDLKYFELRQWQDSPYLSEVALWHGLIFLRQAWQIDLNGCEKFSPESIDQLKATLGPVCFVNIESKESATMDYSNFWARDGFSKDKKF